MKPHSSSDQDAVETAILQHLQRMLEQYQKLDQLADCMLKKQQAGATLDDELQLMESAKQSLAPLESQLVQLRENYLAAVDRPTDDVQRWTQQTTACLKEVIEKVAVLEQATKQAHQKLAPVINQSVRAAQMNQAYGSQS